MFCFILMSSFTVTSSNALVVLPPSRRPWSTELHEGWTACCKNAWP